MLCDYPFIIFNTLNLSMKNDTTILNATKILSVVQFVVVLTFINNMCSRLIKQPCADCDAVVLDWSNFLFMLNKLATP